MRDGTPVDLQIGIARDHHILQPKLLAALGALLKDAGFMVQTRVIDGGWPGQHEEIRQQFDLFIGRWQAKGLGRNLARLVGQGQSENLFNYQSTELERFFEQAQPSAVNRDENRWAYQVHEHLAEDRPLLFLWSTELRSAWRKEFRGPLRPSPFYYYTEFPRWGWFRP